MRSSEHMARMTAKARVENFTRFADNFSEVNWVRAELGKPPLTFDEYRFGTACEICHNKKIGARFCKDCWKAHVAINQSIRELLKAAIAQRREHLASDQKVEGSNPSSRAKLARWIACA